MIAFLTTTAELLGKIASAVRDTLGFGGAAGLSVLQATITVRAAIVNINLIKRNIKTSVTNKAGRAGNSYAITSPPLTSSVIPVTKAESSDAKNAIAAATSSGSA